MGPWQRVVFQWQPDSKSASFVNVFDLAHDTGKNDWLKTVRQVPEPKQWQENGVPWDQIVKTRLAVMDGFPAIKQAYLAAVGDPVTMNGLPVTDVVDMGSAYVLRAQRVVIQQWKEDVPWAKKGQVTFGLGGAIALEAGLLPVPTAGDPEITYTDKAQKFQVSYPYNWHVVEDPGEWQAIVEANYAEGNYQPGIALEIGPAGAIDLAEDAVTIWNSNEGRASITTDSLLKDFQFSPATVLTFGDRKVARLAFSATTPGGIRIASVRYVYFQENKTFYFNGVCAEGALAKNLTLFDWIVSSMQTLK